MDGLTERNSDHPQKAIPEFPSFEGKYAILGPSTHRKKEGGMLGENPTEGDVTRSDDASRPGRKRPYTTRAPKIPAMMSHFPAP
jgi:hypothetical protein